MKTGFSSSLYPSNALVSLQMLVDGVARVVDHLLVNLVDTSLHGLGQSATADDGLKGIVDVHTAQFVEHQLLAEVVLKNEEKVAQIEDDAFKTDADSAQPEGKPFDDAQLGLEWRGMCNRMPKKYVALAQRMKNIDPVITDYPLVEAVADNTFLANEIIEIKPRIEKTLQIALGCPDLKLSVRVAEALSTSLLFRQSSMHGRLAKSRSSML